MISYGMSPTDEKKNTLNQSTCNNHNNNNMKHPSLKRVSFGSSKGSMVETLIYDHPLPEEDTSYYGANITRFGGVINQKKKGNSEPESKRLEAQIRPPSKVRVTFFESQKPHFISSPESGDTALEFDIPAMSNTPSPTQDKPGYMRQESTDSGKDNPFRPDGDLSREADQIVEMIKGGRPITLTPTPELPEDKLDGEDDSMDDAFVARHDTPLMTEVPITPTKTNALENSTPTKVGSNGNAPTSESGGPGAVDVQRSVIGSPSDASQVEHVVLKKKPKCKCCVIM